MSKATDLGVWVSRAMAGCHQGEGSGEEVTWRRGAREVLVENAACFAVFSLSYLVQAVSGNLQVRKPISRRLQVSVIERWPMKILIVL